MQIFGYVLRKPWVKYVDLDLDENVYDMVREAVSKSVMSHIILESLDKDLCDEDCEVLNYMAEISKDERNR